MKQEEAHENVQKQMTEYRLRIKSGKQNKEGETICHRKPQ